MDILNLVLWSVQGFLALFFLAAGAPKIIGRGLERWTGFSDLPRPLVISIGLAEVLGAAGLVLPMATGILPWLTPLAAVGLAIIVLMATGFHIRADERLNALETAFWASIAGIIAIGRWDLVASRADSDKVLLVTAVEGTDAVRHVIGTRTIPEAGIAWPRPRTTLQAVQAVAVRRVLVVSAAPVSTIPSPGRPKPPKHDPGDGFFMRNLAAPLVKAIFRKHYVDLALMEAILRDSGLAWTVVRPPRLTDRPLSGAYRTAYGQNLPRGLSISRADVAHLMLRVLGQPKTIGQVIGVAY